MSSICKAMLELMKHRVSSGIVVVAAMVCAGAHPRAAAVRPLADRPRRRRGRAERVLKIVVRRGAHARRPTLLLALVSLALVAAGTAQTASRIPQSSIVFKVTKTPVFLGPTAQCPIFRSEFQLSSSSGGVIGSGRFCIQTYDFGCDPPPCHDSAGLTLALNLTGGKIEGSGSFAEVFNDDGSVTMTGSATVTRATGIYLGKSGTVDWSGVITFDSDGVPHPDLTFTIALT